MVLRSKPHYFNFIHFLHLKQLKYTTIKEIHDFPSLLTSTEIFMLHKGIWRKRSVYVEKKDLNSQSLEPFLTKLLDTVLKCLINTEFL